MAGFYSFAEGGSPRWLCDYQRQLLNAFVDIEMTGFPFSPVVHQQFIGNAERIYTDYENRLRSNKDFQRYCQLNDIPTAPDDKKRFNFGSPTQLREFLFADQLQGGQELEAIKVSKATGAASTDRESLEHFAEGGNEFCADLLVIRNFGKLLSSFGKPLLSFYSTRTGALHPTYFLAKVIDGTGVAGGTHTGRLSCKHPNMQQIPKRDKDEEGIGLAGVDVRRSFVPLPGHLLVEVDQSQVEVRVAGMYSLDQKMGEFFKAGGDFHTRVASQVFKQDFDALTLILKDKDHTDYSVAKKYRSAAKTFTFGLMFGMGLGKLTRQSGLTDAEGEQFIEDYFDTFPEFARWREGMIEWAKEEGYVTTLFGRRRMIKISGYATEDGREERIGVNTPIQSAAADITLYGLARVWQYLVEHKLKTKILGTVHDSGIYSMPPAEVNEILPVIARMMIRPPGLEWLLDEVPVPLSVGVDIGENFRDMKEISLDNVLAGRII